MSTERTDRGGEVGSRIVEDGPSEYRDDLLTVTSLVGRKWHLVIIAELLHAPTGFSDLEERIDGISSKVLSEHLQDLRSKGLVERHVVTEKPLRVEYSVTARGECFAPIIEAVREHRIAEL